MFLSILLALPACGTVVAACPGYTIIGARATGEPPGASVGWSAIANNILGQVPGGTLYNVVYPAANSQDTSSGEADLLQKVSSDLAKDSNHCFLLIGYSQGSSLISSAMSQLSGSEFAAVKAAVLLGNPKHKKGLACDRDEKGGTSTAEHDGVLAWTGGTIPGSWVSKTLDICYTGDEVCDSPDDNVKHRGFPYGLTSIHRAYPTDNNVIQAGTWFAIGHLIS